MKSTAFALLCTAFASAFFSGKELGFSQYLYKGIFWDEFTKILILQSSDHSLDN